MMPYSARFAIALAAFISSCGPRPGVQLGDGIVLTRELPDSIRRKVESDQKGRAGKDEMDQANIRSASVDTLVVRPDSLILAAGDSIPLYGGPVSWTTKCKIRSVPWAPQPRFVLHCF